MTMDLYLRFVLALGFVLVLIMGLAWIARRAGFGAMSVKPAGRHRRLAIVEAIALDPKRRLVIVRRDNTEHLLVLGATSETVVERGILPPEPFTLPPPKDDHAGEPAL